MADTACTDDSKMTIFLFLYLLWLCYHEPRATRLFFLPSFFFCAPWRATVLHGEHFYLQHFFFSRISYIPQKPVCVFSLLIFLLFTYIFLNVVPIFLDRLEYHFIAFTGLAHYSLCCTILSSFYFYFYMSIVQIPLQYAFFFVFLYCTGVASF